jgi:hypothetical protein
MSAKDELLIPPAAVEDPKSFEIVRVWVAYKNQHVTLMADIWPDPAAWGIMLADLARHVVNSYGDKPIDERARILRRIVEGFSVEIDSPSDQPKGRVLD